MQAPDTRTNRAGESLLSARGLTHGFGRRAVLDNVDIDIKRGELVSVIGPNGAGKTTLIRVLLGLVEPDAGSITRSPGLEIGYVPQRVRVDPTLPLTVARFLTMVRRRPKDTLRAALSDVGLPDLLSQPVQGLSGGEMQRALLARALLGEPDLLVLDEPASGVDAGGQVDLYSLIERIRNERGCGILLVSHDLHLVMASTDRVVCLNRHICCSGHPEAVSMDPEYHRLFGRDAAANLAIYRHHHDHSHDLDGAVLPAQEESSRP